MQVSWHEFKKMLKDANPNLVLGPTINRYAAMVFLKAPGHEDCAPGTDLVEVQAIASPAFFRFCPCDSMAVEGEDGKKHYVRGYNALFRKMERIVINRKRVINGRKLKWVYPSAFAKRNWQKLMDDIKLFNSEELPELQKKKEWLKSRSRPMHGNGMPLGWRNDLSDKAKAELCEAVEGRSARIQDETYKQATAGE